MRLTIGVALMVAGALCMFAGGPPGWVIGGILAFFGNGLCEYDRTRH